MEKQAALRSAFEWVHWQEDEFDIPGHADLFGLSNSIADSVETVAVHSLQRLHQWLWPMVGRTPTGSSFAIGDVSFSVVERLPALDREDPKVGVVVEAAERRWKLAWFDMDGREPAIAVGVRDDEHYAGYEPAAYCNLQELDRYSGGLNAQGDHVGEMFDLFAILRPLMPERLLQVKDGSRNDWKLDGAEVILEFDGGVGGEAATDLHRMAEQFACARVFDWARERIAQAHDFLGDQGAELGETALRFSDGNRLAARVATPYARRIALLETQFPHRDLFDRYLTVADLDDEGLPSLVSVYALLPDDTTEDAVERMNQGGLASTLSHDYRTGITSFAPGRAGFLHVSHFANSVALVSNLARDLGSDADAGEFEIVRNDMRNEP